MTRRSLNWRLLLITGMVAGAAASALYVIHGWQLGRTAQQLLVFAQQRERDGKWLEAAEYLDRYLRVKPTDLPTKIRLPLTYAKGVKFDSHRERAIELHFRALATGDKSSEIELRCGLAELLLGLDPQRHEERAIEAERQAKLALDKQADNPRAMKSLALALNRQLASGAFAGQPLKDLKILANTERARALNPDDLELAALHATLLRESPEVVQAELSAWTSAKREQEADKCLNEFVAKHDQSAEAHLARYRYRTKYGLTDASTDLEAALRLAESGPGSASGKLAGGKDDQARLADVRKEILFTAATNVLDQARRKMQIAADEGVVRTLFAESKGHFEQLVASLEEHDYPQAHLGLGDACLGLNDLDGALAVWRSGIERAVKLPANSLWVQAEYQARIADACLANNRQAEAAAALSEVDSLLAKLGSSIPQSYFMTLGQMHDLRRARWHIQKQAYAAALPLLRSVLVHQGTGENSSQLAFQANYLMGAVYGELGQWVEAATAYEKAANLQPTVVHVQLATASAWQRAGRADLARERADKAHAIKPSRDSWYAIAGAELQLQRVRPPEDRNWSRLDEALAGLSKSANTAAVPDWRIAFLQAEYTAVKSQPDAELGAQRALQVLRAAETQHAKEHEFLRQLCLVYQGMNLPGDADRVLAIVQQGNIPDLENELTHARLLSMRGDDSGAAKVLQRALPSASPAAANVIRAELIRALLAAKDWEQARGLLVQALAVDPQNISLLRRLAELDLERNQPVAVQAWEKRLAEQGPVGESLANYFRAWRVFRSAKDTDATELRAVLIDLDKVSLAQPNWAEAAALKAMTLQRLGHLEQAVAEYERAVNNGDRRVVVLEQLVLLLDKLERPDDVEKYLARLESQAPLTQWATEFASAHEMRHERTGRALELASKRAEQHPDDAAAQLWLGRMLMMANQRSDAEAVLERAAELAPDNIQAWETLLALYSRAKDLDQIRNLLKRLDQNSALAKGRKYLLNSRAYLALGDLPSAVHNAKAGAETEPNNAAIQLQAGQFLLRIDPAQAAPYLEAAVRLEPNSAPARQLLAIARAATGELSEVESLLSAIGPGQITSSENVRLHALLLIQQGGPENLHRARERLEDLAERPEGNQPIDRLLLARLFELQMTLAVDGEQEKQLLGKAENQLVALASAGNAQPAHLAAAAQFFSRHGRKNEASQWLKKLEGRVDVATASDAGALALVLETQLQQHDVERSATWLARLKKVEPDALRPVALQCRVAAERDPNADIEAILEPAAATLLAAATSPEQSQQLQGAVGSLYRALQRLPDAERWFRQLYNAAPQQYASLVGVLAAQQRLAEAIAICESAAQSSDSPQPALILAAALVEAQATPADLQQALPLLADAVKRFGENPNVLYDVALIHILRNSNAEAVPLLRKVIALNSRHVPALNNLALLLADSPEHRAEAVRLIDEAIHIAGPSAGLLDTKGSILVYSGRSAEAIEPLQSATRESQSDPRHHFHLAIAYFNTGRLADAKRHMQIAMDRQLATQVLTTTDRQLLTKLLSELKMEKPVSTAVIR